MTETTRRRGRPAIFHDNAQVQRFLDSYFCSSDLCEDYPVLDDIFSGVLELKCQGDTATRSLSRQRLFHVLRQCSVLDVTSINGATHSRYAYPTLVKYAAVARVASTALAGFLERLPTEERKVSLKAAREELDAPFHAELRTLGSM